MSTKQLEELVPIGFWRRSFASLIDSFILTLITYPAFLWAYGRLYFVDPELVAVGGFESFMDYGFPLLFVLLFWIWRSATPGKLLLDMEIVDARTGGKPSLGQWVIRYVGYFVAVLPLGLGILWVAWDKKKQGWHDKMAKTLVVERDPFEALNDELDGLLAR